MTNQTITKERSETDTTTASHTNAAAVAQSFPLLSDTAAQQLSKAAKAKEVLHTVSMTVPIIGAIGTLFVWAAANFYVGDVEVVTGKQSPDLIVNVFNQKGIETTFRTNKFQLMPGQYRIEVCPDPSTKVVSDLDVEFHTVNRIVVPLSSTGTTTRQTPIVFGNDNQSAAAAVSIDKTTSDQGTQVIEAPSLSQIDRPSEQEVLPPDMQSAPVKPVSANAQPAAEPTATPAAPTTEAPKGATASSEPEVQPSQTATEETKAEDSHNHH